MIEHMPSEHPADCGCGGHAKNMSMSPSIMAKQPRMTNEPAQTSMVAARPLPGSSAMARNNAPTQTRVVTTKPRSTQTSTAAGQRMSTQR